MCTRLCLCTVVGVPWEQGSIFKLRFSCIIFYSSTVCPIAQNLHMSNHHGMLIQSLRWHSEHASNVTNVSSVVSHPLTNCCHLRVTSESDGCGGVGQVPCSHAARGLHAADVNSNCELRLSGSLVQAALVNTSLRVI